MGDGWRLCQMSFTLGSTTTWEWANLAGSSLTSSNFDDTNSHVSGDYIEYFRFQVYPGAKRNPKSGWNPGDAGSEIDLSDTNLTVTRRSSYSDAYDTVRSDQYVSDNTYFEVRVNSGFADSGDYALGIGFADYDFALTGGGAYLGNAGSNSVAAWSPYNEIYFNTGVTEIWNNNPSNVLVPGDVICIAYDPVNKSFWARLNSGYWNNDIAADPATNTGGQDVAALPDLVYAALCIKGGGSGVATALFSSTDWVYTAPSGFAGSAPCG
jgi:hypothetical protein